MAADTPIALNGLARALIQQGRLTEADVMSCPAARAGSASGSLLQELAERKLMSLREAARFAAQTFGYPLLDLAAIEKQQIPRDAVDRKLIQKHQVVPLARRQNRLTLAVADPSNLRALDEIRFQTGAQLDLVVVEADKLLRMVETLSESAEDALRGLTGEDFDMELLDQEAPGEAGGDEVNVDVDDTPVVRFIQKVLVDAINEGASDIHFEPYEKYYRIRVRTDGVLREIAQPPLMLKERMAARIKIISRLDISEKRVPQDGRMKLTLSKTKAIDFRVSTLPTLHGEKIVMRILDPSSAMLGVDALGYEPEQKKALLDAIARPYGMILVTGPTGSGKTVSLYTCLNMLNKAGVNISTAEDPAEINLAGINQVNVNEKAGLTFAAALRAFLRQDPDVIMVGEIRDLETADIAIKAAQTGHLVLSTLHTNDAPQTIARLMNMGVAPFNITSSVSIVIAQRLARRLHDCKKEQHLPRAVLLEEGFTEDEIDAGLKIYEAVGCSDCTEGFKGRTGIYQVMPMTDEIQSIILASGNVQQITEAATRSGVRDLRQSALIKVKNGITSLAEINRVTKD